MKFKIWLIVAGLLLVPQSVYASAGHTEAMETTLEASIAKKESSLSNGVSDVMTNAIDKAKKAEIKRKKRIAKKKQEKKEEKEKKKRLAKQSDIDIMAHVLMAEAGGESKECLYAVGSMIVNRMNDSYYHGTLEEVIYRKGQFECTWNGAIEKTPTDLCYEVAKDVLTNGSTIPENVVYAAEFLQGSGLWKEIDGMMFCYK
ncbi:cell wall hydrolase [Eubacterium oxidoreducens]|uniref:Cell Wall Hydrolase n=1 Tax=Eubacterium oxidoreducens TaxID=1732 RepID=A0A1G6B328_EUBOX|nr:cell wall hydrolase [Eubacterium oxidoreducens]SDB15005.1 Cell Wall Hydrolase [Eubacterium oxidoreducens]